MGRVWVLDSIRDWTSTSEKFSNWRKSPSALRVGGSGVNSTGGKGCRAIDTDGCPPAKVLTTLEKGNVGVGEGLKMGRVWSMGDKEEEEVEGGRGGGLVTA